MVVQSIVVEKLKLATVIGHEYIYVRREGVHGAFFQPSSRQFNLADADTHELPGVVIPHIVQS
jgi:hypothetical protein